MISSVLYCSWHLVKCRAGGHEAIQANMNKLFQCVLFPHGVGVWVVGGGEPLCFWRVCVLLCSDSPFPLISLSLSLCSLAFLTSSTPLCLPALFLTLGWQWRAPAPPLHRWRFLPHPTHFERTMEIIQWSCRPCWAGKWSPATFSALCCFSGWGGWLGDATARLHKWKCRLMVL